MLSLSATTIITGGGITTTIIITITTAIIIDMRAAGSARPLYFGGMVISSFSFDCCALAARSMKR